jgi:hypothetical protein
LYSKVIFPSSRISYLCYKYIPNYSYTKFKIQANYVIVYLVESPIDVNEFGAVVSFDESPIDGDGFGADLIGF